jgi:hypothetical protein
MIWQRFYRLIGGRGPGEDDAPGALPPFRRSSYFASWLASKLVLFGFLKRDPAIQMPRCSYFINHLWQWRFWRTAYRDWMLVNWRRKKPAGWWDVVLHDRRLARWIREKRQESPDGHV